MNSPLDLEKLRLAGQLLEEVCANLETGKTVCPTCGTVRSIDQEQRTVYEMLKAAQSRVRRAAEWMSQKANPERTQVRGSDQEESDPNHSLHL